MTIHELYAHAERLLAEEQWPAAAEALRTVVQHWPHHGSAHHLLAKAEARLGRWEAAEALQRQSCALHPQLGWNAFALGELLERRGARQEAQQAFAAAAAALPQHGWIEERARRLSQWLQWEGLRALGQRPRFSVEQLTQLVWQLRPDLHERCSGEPDNLWIWLLVEGAEVYLGAVLLRDALMALVEADGLLGPACLQPLGAGAGVEPPISLLVQAIWFQQPALQRRFDLNTLAGREGLLRWYVLEAVAHYQLQPLLRPQELAYVQATQGPGAPLVPPPPPATTEPPGAELCRLQEAPLPFGVNLIGYAEGQLGIGEDLRMAVLALDAVGIPCSVFNVHPDPAIACGAGAVSERIQAQLPYRFNLFCLTGIETARVGISNPVPLMLPGRVNIGAWPWEFARWPAQWAPAYGLVDEIWASSGFAQEAYRADGAVPVAWMPMVVDVAESAGLGRGAFQLPASAYLFVFAFDCSSSLRRKNPWAVLEAFQRAFPLGEGADVGLVVKVMRSELRHPAYRRLRQRAAADPRIHLIEHTLPRAALLDLYRACDAFVSLHRCEGFGRAIAEAMLLGKAVVATGYSGNLDFCTAATAQLVPALLKPVLPGDYPHAQGLAWAEPDGEAAIAALQGCQRGTWRPDAGAVAQVAERYSAAAVGARYRQRLEQLWQAAGV